MFYLTEELVVLALCDRKTSDAEKSALVCALLRDDHPQSFLPRKPEFKAHQLKDKPHDARQLADFVWKRSWLIVELLDANVT